MSYTTSETHYHPCELQHHHSLVTPTTITIENTTTSLYESELPYNAHGDQEYITCATPQPLAHSTDSDSDDSDSTTSSSSSSSTTKKHSKKKNRRSHSSTSSSTSRTSSSRTSSFVVSEKVKKQGDLAINDLLNRLQKRQDSFGMLSTTHYGNEGVYGTHDHNEHDDDNDDDGEGEGWEETEEEEGMRVAVHHQGLAPELLREMLGPHAIRQHHGNANLRHI